MKGWHLQAVTHFMVCCLGVWHQWRFILLSVQRGTQFSIKQFIDYADNNVAWLSLLGGGVILYMNPDIGWEGALAEVNFLTRQFFLFCPFVAPTAIKLSWCIPPVVVYKGKSLSKQGKMSGGGVGGLGLWLTTLLYLEGRTFVLTLVRGTAKSYKNKTPLCDLPFYSFKWIGVWPNLGEWVCMHVKWISQVNWLIDQSVSDFTKTH